jgi:hypothetical protein
MIRYFCFLILDQSESYAIIIGVRLRELKIVKREKKKKSFTVATEDGEHSCNLQHLEWREMGKYIKA